MKWYAMSEEERLETLFLMHKGNAFDKALAELWAVANPYNDEKLACAFPEIVERYAPKGRAEGL